MKTKLNVNHNINTNNNFEIIYLISECVFNLKNNHTKYHTINKSVAEKL